jgi:two-component system, LuxR family, response regulator FixJ
MADGDFTVYVVDDNAGVRHSMEEMCEAEGLAVQTYASSEDFLAGYDARRHGCLILDVRLRSGSGLDLQDELARRKATLPVVVLTAYGNVPTSVRAFKAGAVDFLQKPVSPPVLLQLIRDLISRDREARDAAAPRDQVRQRIAELTPRERQILDMLVEGLISKEIAARIGVSTRTVEGHRRQVLRKMGVTSAAQLVRIVMSGR